MKIIKTLDLLNYDNRPVMQLAMPDGSTLHITLPNKSLITRLMRFKDTISEMQESSEPEAVLNEMYDLAAKLMSCNLKNRVITSEELSGEDGISLEFLTIFFKEYFDFVNSITNSKN